MSDNEKAAKNSLTEVLDHWYFFSKLPATHSHKLNKYLSHLIKQQVKLKVQAFERYHLQRLQQRARALSQCQALKIIDTQFTQSLGISKIQLNHFGALYTVLCVSYTGSKRVIPWKHYKGA